MKSILLIGMGKFGQTLGEKLINMGDEVMIVDKNEDIINELMELDIANLTPLEAMNALFGLQNKIKNRW